MAGKAPPCITMMLCVAGCSTTSTGTLPHSRTLPPPNYDVNGVAARTTEPVWDRRPSNKVTGAPDVALAQQKPVTIDVPMPVVEGKSPSGPVLTTKFETVPESHLTGGSKVAEKSAKRPFFTPLRQPVSPPSDESASVIDANAFLDLPLTDLLPPGKILWRCVRNGQVPKSMMRRMSAFLCRSVGLRSLCRKNQHPTLKSPRLSRRALSLRRNGYRRTRSPVPPSEQRASAFLLRVSATML